MLGFFQSKCDIDVRIVFSITSETGEILMKNNSPSFMSAKSVQEIGFAVDVVQKQYAQALLEEPNAKLDVSLNGKIHDANWLIAHHDLDEFKNALQSHGLTPVYTVTLSR